MNFQIELNEKVYEIDVTAYGQYEDDIQLEVDSVIDEDGEEVTDDDLIETLVEIVSDRHADTIHESWYENKVGEAESYFEGDR